MFRALARAALPCIATLLHSPITAAADRWGGSIAAMSDYVSHGLSHSDAHPALQAGAYRAFGRYWSLGGSIASVDLGDWIGASYEVSANLTRTFPLGENWSIDASYARYFYPNARYDYDYGEWSIALSYRDWLRATAALYPDSADYLQSAAVWHEGASALDIALLQPINERWSWLAGLGYHDPSNAAHGYWFWSAGLVFSWSALQLDILHIDTDDTAVRLFGSERAGSRLSAALTWKF